jgi:hypothetical protein
MGVNRPKTRPYDVVDAAEDMLPRQHIAPLEAVATMIGTYAAVTKIVDLFVVPANSNIIITGASCKKVVGGTAAATASAWGIGHYLIGTGDPTVFGTLLFGTHADATYHNFSVTSTSIPAGNVVALLGLIGTTSEESQTMSYLTIEYKEDWTTSA